MNLISYFKKACICVAIIVGQQAGAMDPDHNDLREMQKEAHGIGAVLLERLDNARQRAYDKSAALAESVTTQFEKASDAVQDQVKKFKESELYTTPRKALKAGYDTVTQGASDLYGKVKNFDFGKTKKAVKHKVDSGIKTVKSASNTVAVSFKDWWNNKSEYSSDELMVLGGATVVAAVTIAGVTYVLYKNGTLKKIVDGVATYPTISGTIVALFGLTGYIAYKIATAPKEEAAGAKVK